MLKLALILLSLAVWVSIFAYFWHQNILRWLDNRFGRDTLPTDPDEEGAEGLDHNTPLFTAPQPQDGKTAPSESSPPG